MVHFRPLITGWSQGVHYMAFHINQRVVYPAHGVALVEAVVDKTVGGRAISFYKLSFLYKDMTILIPVEGNGHGGMRSLSDPRSLEHSLSQFAAKIAERQFEAVDISPSAWNKRHKDYQNRMQIGTFDAVLDIYGELMHIAQTKDLSFGEKGLLQAAEELLAQELIETSLIDRSQALELVRAPFKQFVVTYTPHTLHSSII